MDPLSRKSIIEALYNEIKGDDILEVYVKKRLGSGEIYRFLSETIEKPPILVVVIDEKTRQLEEACNSIPVPDKHIVEFKIYERVDARIKNAFLFKPISGKSPPPPNRGITPQFEYVKPLLESLVELGGRGRTRDVLSKVYEKMKDRLTPADLERLPSGNAIRWRNYAMWTRQKLKEDGYLKSDSPKGIWEISLRREDVIINTIKNHLKNN